MLPVAIALLVIGLLLTLTPAIWVGIPAAIVGLGLLLAYAVGIGRRASRTQEPPA